MIKHRRRASFWMCYNH